MTAPWPAVEALVPHRAPMLLIDRVIAAGEDWIRVAARPRSDAWYADAAGAMPAWLGLELMAQAIAAYRGLQSAARGEAPRLGFLLGSRRYAAARGCFASGEEICVEARCEYLDDSGLGAFDCRILEGGDVLAQAVMKVYEPKDED